MDTNNTLPETTSDQPVTPSVPPSASYAVPVSIIIAGGLIALAVFYNDGGTGAKKPKSGITDDQPTGVMEPVSSSDHILGNPSAAVKVVEYSDFECPFCKQFHPTMQQVMNEYGKDGRVAWVYRHLPLDSLHPKARKEAEASECVAKIGGNDKFWAYVNRIFEITPSNNGLDLAEIPKIVDYIGVNTSAFESCFTSGEFATKISESVTEATNAGAHGTPYSIVITASGKQFTINGSQPYTVVKQIIDGALAAK